MRKLTLITALAVLIVAATAALMLGLLQPTGAVGASEQQSVVGELTIEGLNNQPIPVLAYSWGASIPVSDDGGGAGKAILEDVSVTKVMDALTPALFGAVVQGRHFPLANLVVNGAGAGPTHRYFLVEAGRPLGSVRSRRAGSPTRQPVGAPASSGFTAVAPRGTSCRSRARRSRRRTATIRSPTGSSPTSPATPSTSATSTSSWTG